MHCADGSFSVASGGHQDLPLSQLQCSFKNDSPLHNGTHRIERDGLPVAHIAHELHHFARPECSGATLHRRRASHSEMSLQRTAARDATLSSTQISFPFLWLATSASRCGGRPGYWLRLGGKGPSNNGSKGPLNIGAKGTTVVDYCLDRGCAAQWPGPRVQKVEECLLTERTNQSTPSEQGGW